MSREKGKELKKVSEKEIKSLCVRYFRTTNYFSFRMNGSDKGVVRIEASDLYNLLVCGEELCSDDDLIHLFQYLFVLNWKVIGSVIRQEHRFRLGRADSPWVELRLRSKGARSGRPKKSLHGGVRKEDYEDAKNNILVALKYKDEAWFVEYYRRICFYEKKEWNMGDALNLFRNLCCKK